MYWILVTNRKLDASLTSRFTNNFLRLHRPGDRHLAQSCKTTKASIKSVLKKMITAMNRSGDASKRALLNARDIEMFAKPKPKKTVAAKKSPLPLRANVSSKAAKKPRKKIARKKKAKR
jgi:hypothetical protein